MPSSTTTTQPALDDEACMTRARPGTIGLPTFRPTFDAMCAAAAVHWKTTLPAPPDDAPVVVVDVLRQDLRLALRTLTLANSLRDDLAARADDTRVSSGLDPRVRMVEGFVRDGAIVGRASSSEAVIVLDTGSSDLARQVEVELVVDAESAAWWEKRASASHLDASRLVRQVVIGLAGSDGLEVERSPATSSFAQAPGSTHVTVHVPAGAPRLATIVLRSHPSPRAGRLPQSAIGLRINSLTISPGA